MAFAQTEPPFEAKGFQPNREYISEAPFEHVDTYSGNLILSFTDLVLPGNGGRDLRFVRTFNSKPGVPPNWSFGIAGLALRILDPNLDYYPDQSPEPDPHYRAPVLQISDGARRWTAWMSLPDAANPSSLCYVSTSDFWRYDRTTRTLSLPDGTVCYYDSVGRLADVADAFGNTVLTLNWNTGSLGVTQHLGNGQTRQVSVAIDEVNLLPTSVTYGGRTWQYEYAPGTFNLTRVVPPVGPPWVFTYEHVAQRGDELRTVQTPHGGQITYQYDLREFVETGSELTVFSHVMIRRSTAGSGIDGINPGVWEYGYAIAGGGVSQESVVTTPNQTRVTYSYSGGPPAGMLLESSVALDMRTVQEHAASGYSVIERETRTYRGIPALAQTASAIGFTVELTNRTITRGARQYQTTYRYGPDYLGDYHHPNQITETSDVSRTITRTYQHPQQMVVVGPTANEHVVVGLMTSERVTAGTESFDRSWTHDAATGFKRTETVYGVTTTFAPEAFGNVASVTNGNGNTTTYQYAWGLVRETTTPAYSVSRTINEDGTVASETRAGRTTTFTYDALFRPTTIQPPGGTNATLTEYDNVGGAWVRTTRGGSWQKLTVDGFGRPVQSDNSVVRTLTEYDAEGRKIKESYPFATTGTIATTAKYTVMEYDALGRVTKRTNPDNTFSTRRYDPGTVTIRDEEGRETIQTYEAFGDPDDARLVKVHDAKGNDWTYTYNGLGQLRTVTAPDGITRTWTYVPGTNRLATETHPESGTVTYVSYDGAGNLTRKIDAKGTAFVYTYDANERLTTVTAGSTLPRVTITYEPGSDNRATAVTDGITTRYTYDAAGRLEYRQDVVDGEVFSTKFGYDGNDHLTSIRYPKSGRTVEFARDSGGRILTVHEGQKTYASEFTYHPSGAVASYRAGNGLTSTFDFDPNRYWPTRIQSGALDLQYGDYDGVGNVRTIADARQAYTQTFAYDELDRLTGASGVYGTLTYDYDAHGNRTGGSSTTYENDLSKLRLVRQGLRTFTYDDNGNLTSRAGGAGAATFTYTPENLVAGVTTAAGASAYTYDADQWRVKRVTGNQVSYFLRGPTGELLCEWRPGAATEKIRDCIYAGSRMLAVATR